MRLRVITWNLFHGRDFPPDPGLFTWRSRLLRITERGITHVQVNRDLLDEFSAALRDASWDVALLQECPPRWSEPLARACAAEAHRVLTSRNQFVAITSILARCNPDLLGSWEGGSNLTLVRPRQPGGAGGTVPAGPTIVERRELVLAPARQPERRMLAFTRLGDGICVANLHASTSDALATKEIHAAARQAIDWAAGAPLVLGGDLNVRPADNRVYDELRERYDLAAPTAPDAIDHLLARGLHVAEPPRPWATEAREVPLAGLRLRLSDHDPIEATFALAPEVR
jgi:endonuclease/exonuclease/phosphatase family metal-dependent hydrolase